MSNAQLPEPFNRIAPVHIKQRPLASGESLFLQGDTTKGLFYLISGSVELSRETSTGHNIIVHRACEKEIFAEASIFTNVYHCSATALKASEIMECSRTIVDELLRNDLVFTRHVASRFAMQIQESRRRLELMSIRSADDRILAAMHDGLLLDDISRFADLIGLAQETVYRALKRLADSGRIIKTARGQYRTE